MSDSQKSGMERRHFLTSVGIVGEATVASVSGCVAPVEHSETVQGSQAALTAVVPATISQADVTNYVSLGYEALIFDQLTTVVGTSGTSVGFPSSITLCFEKLGRMKLDTGMSAVLNGPILAPPTQEIFDLHLGDAFVPKNSATKYFANWWVDPTGGADIGERWNAMVAGLGTTERQGTGNARLFAVVGAHDTTASMDLTSFRNAAIFDFTGSYITAESAGGVADNYPTVDLTDTSGCEIRGLRLVGSSSAPPGVGILSSRDLLQASRTAGKNVFSNVTCGGFFKTASMCNIGAENNVHLRCRFDNAQSDARATILMSRINEFGFQSAHGNDPGNGASATGGSFHGTFVGGRMLAQADRGVVLVRGYSNLSFRSIYINSQSAPHVLADTTQSSITALHIDDLYTHGAGGGKPDASIETRGILNNELIGFRVVARRINAGQLAIKVGSNDMLCAHLEWFDALGLECDATSRMTSSFIKVRGDASAPSIQLGAYFSGQVYTPSLSGVTSATVMDGYIITDDTMQLPGEMDVAGDITLGGTVRLADNQGLRWGNTRVRGNAGGVTITDGAGDAVMSTSAARLDLSGEVALGFNVPRTSMPGVGADKAALALVQTAGGFQLVARLNNGISQTDTVIAEVP